MAPKRRSARAGRSPSPAAAAPARQQHLGEADQLGVFAGVIGPLLLLVPAPLWCLTLGFITCSDELEGDRTAAGLLAYVQEHGVDGLLAAVFQLCGFGSAKAWAFLGVFNFAALLL